MLRHVIKGHFKGVHSIVLHGYIHKDEFKAHDSIGQTGGKTASINFTDLKVATTHENSDTDIISMCIVPIKIRSGILKKEVPAYAMFGSCSQGYFMYKELVKELQLSGRKTALNLYTLNGEKSESAMTTEGIDVRGVGGNNKWIKLPKMYSRTYLAVDKEEIATPNNIKQLDYLNVIASDITQTDDAQVWLLNGANCMKASEPLTGDFKCR